MNRPNLSAYFDRMATPNLPIKLLSCFSFKRVEFTYYKIDSMPPRSGQLTTNLCNQFLINWLDKRRKHFQKIGMERKSYVYYNVISSIKKYPLPIICQQQLKSLHGVGDTICQELVGVIREHYKAFMKKNKEEADKFLVGEWTQEVQADQYSQSLGVSKTNSLARFKGTDYQSEGDGDDSISVCSFKSVNLNKPYRPKPKSQGAFILSLLFKEGNGNFTTKQLLLQRLKQNYNNRTTPKNLLLLLSNLQKSGYIKRDSQDFNMVKLTTKGENQVDILQAKAKEKDTSVKVKDVLNSFLSKKEGSTTQMPFSLKEQKAMKKTFVRLEEDIQLTILIDTREVKDQQEHSFFEKKMSQKYEVKVKTCNLPIGDFMWSYNGQVLDYVVQRKKADDLVGSIMDGRYKQQKYRLKNSGFTNIFYLFQGHLTGSFSKYQRETQTALLNTRVKQRFKVIEVNNITQSLKFLHFITQNIKDKLALEQSITCLSTIQEVSLLNGKSSQLTVEHIFGMALKTIPGVGKSAINEVLKHFRSFRQLYDQLSQFQSRFEREQFLRQLLKGCNVRTTLPELLVQVLFGCES